MVEGFFKRLRILLPPPLKRLIHRHYSEKVIVVAVEMKNLVRELKRASSSSKCNSSEKRYDVNLKRLI